ncbi:MAG: 50S ribosomal protein L3 N(5)-glutamine methyltransferase [Gammaproteobacteria bacterium]|nr:MAG: 50S ribosomal protein L3 N(5)-glutamine methyltransferase [Gammaproteobacteria bacterium]
MDRCWDEAVEELATVRDLVRWGASRLAEAGVWLGHGTDDPVDEALTLVLHVLRLRPPLAPELFAARLTRRERCEAVALLRRRIEERLPAPYLIGEAWFAGLPFQVDPRVLVPRSPIAELIEGGFQPWLEAPPRRILDLCTGSGAIAVACALAFPEAEVDAVDVSPEALEVARANVARHGVQGRVHLLRSDLYSALGGRRYDLIVSNPPYVSEAELAALPPEYRHEPRLALAAGPEGLDVVLELLRGAAAHLEPGGLLVVEVGATREALERRLPGLPLTWVALERGGEGVFVIRREELEAHAEALAAEAATG